MRKRLKEVILEKEDFMFIYFRGGTIQELLEKFINIEKMAKKSLELKEWRKKFEKITVNVVKIKKVVELEKATFSIKNRRKKHL